MSVAMLSMSILASPTLNAFSRGIRGEDLSFASDTVRVEKGERNCSETHTVSTFECSVRVVVVE